VPAFGRGATVVGRLKETDIPAGAQALGEVWLEPGSREDRPPNALCAFNQSL